MSKVPARCYQKYLPICSYARWNDTVYIVYTKGVQLVYPANICFHLTANNFIFDRIKIYG